MTQKPNPDISGQPSKQEGLEKTAIFDDLVDSADPSADAETAALGDSICSLIGQTRHGCTDSRDELLQQLKTYLATHSIGSSSKNGIAKCNESAGDGRYDPAVGLGAWLRDSESVAEFAVDV